MKDNVVVIGISIGQGIDANKVFIAYGDKFNGISSRISTYIDSEVRLKLVDHDYVAGILAAVKSVDTTVGGLPHDDFIILMMFLGAGALLTVGFVVFALYGGNESKHTEFGTLDSEEQLTVHRLPRAEVRRRVSELKKALLQLDTEWAQYETNLEEFCLTKPMLRDKKSPVIKKYHDMMFDLRNTVESLDDRVDEKSLTTAESLAEDTLSAWGAANDYASQVGVSDLSVTERAALRRLHGLVAQLADPGTPRAMWDSLKEGIDREMRKLTTVPITWKQVAALPEIAAVSSVRPELVS